MIALIKHSLPQYLSKCFSVKSIVDFLVFNKSPFQGHLWYLGAILYVLVIIAVWEGKLKQDRSKLYWLIPVLLLTDLVLGRYSLLIFHRVFPYIYVRNFLCVGLPYFLLGDLINTKIANRESNVSNVNIIISIAAIIVFILTSMLEKHLLISFNLSAENQREHYLSSTLIAVSLFMLAIFRSRAIPTKIEQTSSELGRSHSMMIYLIHPAVITVLHVATETINVLVVTTIYKYTAPVLVFAISIIGAVILKKITTNEKS